MKTSVDTIEKKRIVVSFTVEDAEKISAALDDVDCVHVNDDDRERLDTLKTLLQKGLKKSSN